MKMFTLSLFLTGICMYVSAQESPSFKSLRYEEDYSGISPDSTRATYAQLKHVNLWRDDIFLSLGGSARCQFIKVENEDWGETRESSDVYRLARHLFHADVHGGKRWRTFIEFQSSLAAGKYDVSPLDKNSLELHQFFVDYSMIVKPASRLTVRLGRQELRYGSERVVSVRNGPNNRQSFDGIKMFYASPNNTFDFFCSQFVAARYGSFNDKSNDVLRFWGAYAVKHHPPFNIDLYYLGIYKALAVFDDAVGKEVRHSIGARLWKKTDQLNLDIECIYQFGRLGGQSISAWTASIRSEYSLAGRFNPTIGVKTEIISGDSEYQDDNINTFNPFFPSGAYFGLAALFGPVNLIDFHPSFVLSLSKKVEWNFDYDIFWRHSLNDGIYTNNMRLIYTGRDNSHRFIGHQLSTEVSYALSRFISFSGEFKWFITGEYLDTAGEGENILFGMLSMEFTF